MARIRRNGIVLNLEGRNMKLENGVVVATATHKRGKNISLVGMGENRVFRMYDTGKVLVDPTTEKATPDWTDFAVIDLSNSKALAPLVAEYLLDDGFVYEGKTYKCVLRSASGMRQVKYVFTAHEDLWESLDDVTFGAQFGDVVEMSKVRTREGLALTTTLEVETPFSYKVVDDFERTITVDALQYKDGKMQEHTGDIDIMPTDGMGFVTYEKAVEWARDLELAYVPTAFQTRFAGSKGLLVVWKWDRSVAEHDADVLFLDSMWKYDFDTAKYSPKMEVAAWSKPLKSEYFNLCYQYIQALGIDPKDLTDIADESLSKVENGIMKDATKAMKFLGMIDTIGDGDYEEGLQSKLTEALDANPAIISDFYVQAKLREMVKKFVLDMRKGRVPVKGAYRYVVADPTVIFGNEAGLLPTGKNYYNGYEGTMAAFRSPLIHSSEVTALEFIDVPEFSKMTEFHPEFGKFKYLEGLVVLNTYDDTDPRMGGMDKDGDKVAITPDQRIIDAVKGGRLIYDAENYASMKVKNTREEKYKFDLATMTKNRIGIMTDYATIWTDFMIHKKRPGVDENIQVLRILQGQEIDSVKTGYIPELPSQLAVKFAPHWMEKNLDRNGNVKPEDKQILEYKTSSPMGKLYDHIVEFWKGFSTVNLEETEKHNLTFLRNVDKQEASSIFEYVRNLKKTYGQELMAIWEIEKENPPVDADDSRYQDMRIEVFERYTEIMRAIPADPRTVAAVAYQIAYVTDSNRQGRGISFPWITAFDGMKLLLADVAGSDRFKLVPVYGKQKQAGTFTFFRGETVDAKGNVLMEANVEGGDHEVIELDGRFYVKAPQKATPKTEEAPVAQLVNFKIRGFKYHEAKNATNAFNLLKENDGVACLVEQGKYIGVYVNDTQIGVVGGDDDFTMAQLINKEIKINTDKHTPLTYVSQKDGNIYGSGQVGVTAVVTDELEIIESEDVDLKDDFDAQFKEFGFAGTPQVSFDLESNTGSLVCDFGGQEVKLRVEMDYMENISFDKKMKNPAISEAMAKLVARTITELRTA